MKIDIDIVTRTMGQRIAELEQEKAFLVATNAAQAAHIETLEAAGDGDPADAPANSDPAA